MFMQVLLVALIALAGSLFVEPYRDQCTMFGNANNKHHRCMNNGLFTIKNISHTGVMDAFGNGCRNLVAYTSCMEEWSRNCVDKDTIMAVVGALGAPCNGMDISDWFRNKVAPTFDSITSECLTAVAPMPTCKAAHKDSGILPGNGVATVEGIQMVKTYHMEHYNCFKKDVQDIVPNAPACSNVTWEDVFFFDIALSYGGIPYGTLGRVLTNDQLNELKAMATETH